MRALFPLMAGTPQAGLLFNIAFMVVLASLLIQGSTIGLVARKLQVAMPDAGDEQEVRAVFRDFALDPAASVASVCEFYGLPLPDDPQARLGDWMSATLNLPPVAGDAVRLGNAVLVVREVTGSRITAIGIGLGS